MKHQVVINVSGGVVTDIISTNKDIEIYLIDYDNLAGLYEKDDKISCQTKEEYLYNFDHCTNKTIDKYINTAIDFVKNLWKSC